MAVDAFIGGLSGRAGQVRITGLDGVIKALKETPPGVNKELRKAGRSIANEVAKDIKAAAKNVSPGSPAQASLAAISVQGRSDRMVYISGGGSRILRTTKKVPKAGGGTRTVKRSRPLTAAQVFFGTEFGSKLPQFPPHAGKEGYYFWPTLRRDEKKILEKYLEAVSVVLRRWGNYR